MQLQATEGELLKTGKPRAEVMDALVGLLTEEGYVVDNINEKYGIVSAQPYDIITGQLMTKLGEPGGGLAGAMGPAYKHTIKFGANVAANGDVKIKATALQMVDESFQLIPNPNAAKVEKIDTFRTIKLNEYYTKKLQERLQ